VIDGSVEFVGEDRDRNRFAVGLVFDGVLDRAL